MKNGAGKRDPGMHKSKTGNQWYSGMKAHIRVDADLGLAHTTVIAAAAAAAASAAVSDVSRTETLLHDDERHLHAVVAQFKQARCIRSMKSGAIAPRIMNTVTRGAML